MAKLQFKGDTDKFFPVQHFSFNLSQSVDGNTGEVLTNMRGGTISLILEYNGGTEMMEWAAKNKEEREGSIYFFELSDDGDEKKLVTFTFKEAILTSLSTSMSGSNVGSHTQTLTISARIIIADEKELIENKWKKKKSNA